MNWSYKYIVKWIECKLINYVMCMYIFSEAFSLRVRFFHDFSALITIKYQKSKHLIDDFSACTYKRGNTVNPIWLKWSLFFRFNVCYVWIWIYSFFIIIIFTFLFILSRFIYLFHLFISFLIYILFTFYFDNTKL